MTLGDTRGLHEPSTLTRIVGGSPAKRRVQRGAVDGIADEVAIVVLCDQEDIVGSVWLRLHDRGEGGDPGVAVVERVDEVSGAAKIEYVISSLRISAAPIGPRNRRSPACNSSGRPQTDQWSGPPVFATQIPL